MEHKIKLKFGFTDKNNIVHRDVTFGKRLTVGDMMRVDTDPRCQIPTQYSDILNARMITKFGKLPIPPALDVLLSLNSVDREDIEIGTMNFLASDVGEMPENLYPKEPKCRIPFGFDFDGTRYTEIELRNLNTGRDEVEADGNKYRGITRECFLIGRRITRIETLDGIGLDGPIDVEKFESLDAVELNFLRMGANKADLFFRIFGKSDAVNGPGEGGGDPVKSDESVGSGNTVDADGTDGNVPEDTNGTV